MQHIDICSLFAKRDGSPRYGLLTFLEEIMAAYSNLLWKSVYGQV